MPAPVWIRRLGRRLWGEGQRVEASDMNASETALLALIGDQILAPQAALIESFGIPYARGVPQSGFRGIDGFPWVGGDDVVSITAGWVDFYDATKAESPWEPAYVRAVLAETTVQIAPNTSGSTRFDRIYCTVGTVDDETDPNRRILQLAPGSMALQSIEKRRSFVATVAVVQGTPGEGLPDLPDGAVEIAQVRVPDGTPTTASITVQDARHLIWPGAGYERIPDTFHTAGISIGSSFTVSDGGGGTVDVTAGWADIQGYRTVVNGVEGLALAPPHATHDRIDLVYVGYWSDGLRKIQVHTGTPGAEPDLSLPEEENYASIVPLAWVRVAGSTGALTITDARRHSPGAALDVRPAVLPRVTVSADGTPETSRRRVRVQLVDVDGMPRLIQAYLRVELLDRQSGTVRTDADLYFDTLVSVWQNKPTATAAVVQTSSAGVVTLNLRNNSVSSVTSLLRITPVLWADATGTSRVLPEEPTYVPGAVWEAPIKVGPSV